MLSSLKSIPLVRLVFKIFGFLVLACTGFVAGVVFNSIATSRTDGTIAFFLCFGSIALVFRLVRGRAIGVRSLAYCFLGLLTGYIVLLSLNHPTLRSHSCIRASDLSNKYTPVDMYKSVSRCVKQGKNNEGVLLFSLAGAYGRFDSLRVTDKSAHQAVTILKMKMFENMTPDQQNALKGAFEKTLGSPEGLANACNEIRRIGPPNYVPTYMLQHGMGAFLKNGTNDGLAKDFDSQAAWKQTLDLYLHCPGL